MNRLEQLRNYQEEWLMQLRPAALASALKPLMGIKRRWTEGQAGWFWIDPVSNFGRAIGRRGDYEPAMGALVRELLRDGDTFVDLGANEGFFSIVAAHSVGAQGRVISIEPQSRLQSVLVKNQCRNNAYTMRIFQVAIGDRDGQIDIHLSPDVNTGSSGVYQTTRYKTPTEPVLQLTLSSFIQWFKLDSIRLMKVDIEGYEYEAILGGEQILSQGIIEYIALEFHPTVLKRRQKSIDDITQCLHRCGYVEEARTGIRLYRHHSSQAG